MPRMGQEKASYGYCVYLIPVWCYKTKQTLSRSSMPNGSHHLRHTAMVCQSANGLFHLIIVKTCTSINGAFYIWFVIIKILARHRSSIHIPVEDDANRKEQLHCIKNSRRITVPYHLLICQLDS